MGKSLLCWGTGASFRGALNSHSQKVGLDDHN